MILRLVHGRWPVTDAPATALDALHRDIVQDYDRWLRDLRGLSPETRTKRTAYALRFLASLGLHSDQESLARLGVRDIDGYLKQCYPGLRRASIEDCTVCLRDFLRHLYRSGATASDLSGTVIGPRIYEQTFPRHYVRKRCRECWK
jgi:integrase/recombinase XerD